MFRDVSPFLCIYSVQELKTIVMNFEVNSIPVQDNAKKPITDFPDQSDG